VSLALESTTLEDDYWPSDWGRGQAPRYLLRSGFRLLTSIAGNDFLDGIDIPPFIGDAICGSIDPELFFPDPGDVAQSQTARRICGSCPVLDQCRDYARERPELMGTWGGESERTRQVWRSRTAR
jgi:WhiB family redox-sensing transcriptional regulator